MYSDTLRDRLRDPAYLDMHMAAVAAVRGVKAFPWYDAHFLQVVEAAKRYLGSVAPDKLEPFGAALSPLKTPTDFEEREIADIFSADTLARVRQEVAAIPAARYENHELGNFGRHVVHDLPYFTELQREMVPLVSELAGRPLAPSYNFLSLYGNTGRCAPHMDHPVSMYTLDMCVDQNVEWPIWFSDVVDWPTREMMNNFDPERLIAEVPFHDHVLRPNQAIFFSGAGQWHYRDAMPRPGFCNLLFFHYYPTGTLPLVDFRRWPDSLGMPELAPLTDLFAETFPQEFWDGMNREG